MWERTKRFQGCLNLRQDQPHFFPVSFPGKVNGRAVFLVERAHPQIVGGNHTEFTDKEERGNLLAQTADRFEGRHSVAAWDKILGLDFLAAAGR